MILVSVIIKALNEERHIAAAIESALAAVEGIHAEVIIADSASTDRTVEISSRYPVKIVQLARPDERGCGVGPQLGYQHGSGSYICLMDGDMVLDAGFIKRGLDFLSRNPSVAGVGGLIVEKNVTNLEFRRRVKRKSADQLAGSVGRLNGGGAISRIRDRYGRLFFRPQFAWVRGIRARDALAGRRMEALSTRLPLRLSLRPH